MAQIQGTIEYVNDRDTAYGKMYAYKVAGVNYSIGKKQPTANKGDLIAFTAEQKGNYWNVVGEVQILGRKAVAPADAAMPTGYAVKASGGTGGRTYMDDERKQGIISKQAARNSAIATTKIVQEAGLLPEVAKGKNKGEQHQSLLRFIDELTEKYHADALGLDNPKAPGDNGEAQAAADAASDTGWLG